MENHSETSETKPAESTTRKTKFPTATVAVAVIVFILGYFSGGGKISISSGKIEITKGNIPSTSADYSLLWDTLDALNNKFVDRPLDQQKLLYGAVAGMVNAVGDPYTTFFDPKDAAGFAEDLSGKFDGIGAEIGVKDEQIVVIAPLEDTPAAKSGILAGDAILGINDESTTGMTVDAAVDKIRGKAGTQVKLTVLHEGAKTPTEINITRAQIEVKSVKLDTKEIDGKKIAVIKISKFGDDTKGLLDTAVGQIASGSYDGVIVDLRNDPGGYLETAVSTISNWTDEGTVVLKEKGYGGTEKTYTSTGVPRLKGMKTVLLVNGGSASASEIVAGALQDYGIATLVGEKTFGKGSVQELLQLKDKAEVKITVAKWFTPKDRGINGTGLEPDVPVELTAEDAQNQKDPQMDKALELLK